MHPRRALISEQGSATGCECRTTPGAGDAAEMSALEDPPPLRSSGARWNVQGPLLRALCRSSRPFLEAQCRHRCSACSSRPSRGGGCSAAAPGVCLGREWHQVAAAGKDEHLLLAICLLLLLLLAPVRLDASGSTSDARCPMAPQPRLAPHAAEAPARSCRSRRAALSLASCGVRRAPSCSRTRRVQAQCRCRPRRVGEPAATRLRDRHCESARGMAESERDRRAAP
jgi:hypothetical protein